MTNVYLWEILVNILENVIFTFLLFDRLTLRNLKYRQGIFICFVFLLSSLISICNILGCTTITTHIFAFILRLLLLTYFFRNSFSQKLFTCCLPNFISMFADQITYTAALIIAANRPDSFDFLGSNRILSTLLYLATEFTFLLIFRMVLTDISFLPQKLYGFLVFITTIALFISTYFLNIIIDLNTELMPINYRMQLNGISTLILLLFLSMLYLIQVISKTYESNMSLASQLRIREKDAERNRALLQSAENLRKWKHDYNNHLIAIQGLIDDHAYDRLKQYMVHQQETLSENFLTINTGHNIVDAILTDKFTAARKENIRFSYSILLPKPFPIDDIELTGILGNLLDNALEACREIPANQSPAPYIRVTITPKRNMLHIFIENSASGNYAYDHNGHLKTTKPNKEIHGNGLTHVAEIAAKHSGFCTTDAQPDRFSINVYIPLT